MTDFRQQYQPLEHRRTGLKVGVISLERRPQFFTGINMNQTPVKRRYLVQKNLRMSSGVLNLERTIQEKLLNETDIQNENTARIVRNLPQVRPVYPKDKPEDQANVGFYPNTATRKVGVPKWGDRRVDLHQDGAPTYQIGLSVDKVRGAAENIKLFLFNNQIPKTTEPEAFENELSVGFMASAGGRETAAHIRARPPNQLGLEDRIVLAAEEFRRRNPDRHAPFLPPSEVGRVLVGELTEDDIAPKAEKRVGRTRTELDLGIPLDVVREAAARGPIARRALISQFTIVRSGGIIASNPAVVNQSSVVIPRVP